MTRRFTVIQGGLPADPAQDAVQGPAALSPPRLAPVLTLCQGGPDSAAGLPAEETRSTAVDRTALEAAGANLRRRLAELKQQPVAPGPAPAAALPAPGRPVLAWAASLRRAIPAQAFLGVRPEGWALGDAAGPANAATSRGPVGPFAVSRRAGA